MILDVRFTSSAAYEVHNICATAGLPYARLTAIAKSRYRHDFGTQVPNILIYVESVALLLKNWESLQKSVTRWSAVVNASEDEAGELDVPYSPRATQSWIVSSLILDVPVTNLIRVSKEPKMNTTYLTPIITELYKIQPKESRPFSAVFKFLAGASTKLDTTDMPASLIRAVANAEPLRLAIDSIEDTADIVQIRAVAKDSSMDVFEINYTLAKAAQCL